MEFLKSQIDLIVIIALATLLQCANVLSLPWLAIADLPLGMLRVFFHELSHGIGALVTGGSFYTIELAFGQGGLAHTTESTGRYGFITIFAGYFGPSVWGLLIYLGFTRWLRSGFDLVPYICMGIALATLLLWVRDIRTAGIVMLVAAIFQSIGRFESDREMNWAIKFIAVYLVTGGALDPYLFYHYPEFYTPEMRLIWDGAALSDITTKSESFWVNCWVGCSAASFIIILLCEWIDRPRVFTVLPKKLPADIAQQHQAPKKPPDPSSW